MQTGIRACVAGGKLVIVGLGSEEAKLPVAAAACKEIDIVGSFRYANTVRLWGLWQFQKLAARPLLLSSCKSRAVKHPCSTLDTCCLLAVPALLEADGEQARGCGANDHPPLWL